MYRLSAQDNGLYFFYDRPDVKRCQVCRALLKKWEEVLAGVPIVKPPKYDASYSYDGVLVVTERFRKSVEARGITGLEFRPLRGNLFAARSGISVQFDAVRRGTRFEKQCESCGQYESVIGATPIYLLSGEKIPEKGFVRTDLEFGSSDEKAPKELCGDEAARELQKAGLRGVDLLPVKEVGSTGNKT